MNLSGWIYPVLRCSPRLFFRFAFAGLLLSCFAQPLYAADLLEIYRLAQANDPTIDAARYSLAAAQQKVPQARAGLLPALSLNGSDTYNKTDAVFGNATPVARDVHTWTWTLQLTQPIYRAQNIYAYSESGMQVEQARAQYALAEQELILRVTQAYFDVLVVQGSIEVADKQVKAAEEQVALAKRGFETGATAITDMHEARSRAELARAQRIAALNELETKHAELEKLVGQETRSLAGLQAAVVLPRPQPSNVRDWIEHARENNPAVLAPRAAVGAAEAKVHKSRAEYAPTLDLVASYGKNSSSGNVSSPVNFETRTESTQVGVQLSMPLFSGGGTNARVKEAIANVGRANAELESARRKSGTDARQAYAAVINGLAQIEALESAVEFSTSSVKGNKVGYKLGINMNIDVLNAEQQLYTAQRDLVKARYETLLQGHKLKAAAGVLSEADVIVVNRLLAR